MKVAIDGPAGAGKSAVARAAAKDLGFIYVDTGALYRTIGLFALRQGVDPHSGEEVIPLLDEFPEMPTEVKRQIAWEFIAKVLMWEDRLEIQWKF